MTTETQGAGRAEEERMSRRPLDRHVGVSSVVTDALLGVTTSVVAVVDDRFPIGNHVVPLGDIASDGTRLVGWDADPDRCNWARQTYFPDVDALAESMRPGVLAIVRLPRPTDGPTIAAALAAGRDLPRPTPALVSPTYSSGHVDGSFDGYARRPWFLTTPAHPAGRLTVWETMPPHCAEAWGSADPPLDDDDLAPLVDDWSTAHTLHLDGHLAAAGRAGAAAARILKREPFALRTIVGSWDLFCELAHTLRTRPRLGAPARLETAPMPCLPGEPS
ncbi:hypothetical protein [Embleya sp. NPDC020630]|uniref:hypothetical protein n=1 Tax=Embleya sp. NPDC020630 TaxID=3363979 RepID=UPI0037A656E1